MLLVSLDACKYADISDKYVNKKIFIKPHTV